MSGGTFNPQIFTHKLAQLSNTQQSIETLSHWCIFHMNQAKLVVQTWDEQFRITPREQRISYIYLANDIMQKSRKKGADFITEFWRVLPDALRDVITNGNHISKNAALRMINIWEERKVFGSCGKILKEEFIGRNTEENNKSERQLSAKIPPCVGITILDKIVSDYEAVYGRPSDEESIFSRCNSTITTLEKVVKDINSGKNSGEFSECELGKTLKEQHMSLKECIDQLTELEASQTNLVSHLKEAIQEQESKLEQGRRQLRVALLQSEQATNLCRQLVSSDNVAAVGPTGDDDSRKSKSTVAVVAARLAATTSSAEMLSHVISSWAKKMFGYPSDEEQQQSEKRLKLDNGPPMTNRNLPRGKKPCGFMSNGGTPPFYAAGFSSP